jgi:hypothetical protein
MKINLDNWDRKPVKFYCDGIEIDRVIEADDVEGYIEFIDTGGNGKPYYDENHEVATKKIYGKIRIDQDIKENNNNALSDS